MMIVRPSEKKIQLVEACTNAFFRGITLLSNNSHCRECKMQGCGMVIYRNWCELLREENRRNAKRITCIFLHVFIHYKNKQFFDLCINIIPDITKEWIDLAIRQYEDILSFAIEIAVAAQQQDSFSRDSLNERKVHIIEMLRRSSEQEKLILSYLKRAVEHIRK